MNIIDKTAPTIFLEYPGTVPEGEPVPLTLTLNRAHGAVGAAAIISSDEDGSEQRFELEWRSLHLGCDIYKTTLPAMPTGLYFISLSLALGSGQTLILPANADERYQLTVYAADYSTPDWIKGGIIYQIFPDRFARSSAHLCKPKSYATLRDDWDDGIPPYPEKPGDPLENTDFFGGTLYGVAEKLDYLSSLGVNTIYLNPIFEARSNHRYDTGDFSKVDSMLGGEEALEHLIAEASKRNIHIILDGVFSHTGDDSRYFNKYGSYPTKGAYTSCRSPYYSWYTFRDYPEDYDCWWGVKVLPTLNKNEPSLRRFIYGERGIVRKYLKTGISGWRLDVADELPDDFIEELRSSAKQEAPDSLIIGEIWEDASNKIAYDRRRKYLQGRELDSVMNYPLRSAIIDYMRSGDASLLSNTMNMLCRHYPPQTLNCLMNILGTHDTIRILTALGGDEMGDRTNAELSVAALTDAQREYAIKLLKLAYLLCATLPGVPSIYYGDEAGMEGYRDPFNRRCYPWGREDDELIGFYRCVGEIRRSNREFEAAPFTLLNDRDGAFIFKRGELVIAVNRSEREVGLYLAKEYNELLSGASIQGEAELAPFGAAIYKPIK